MPTTRSTPADRPRTRQRVHKPPPALSVPDIDEDAAERKRVLNVLAQRRYRRRKREARLGARAPHEGSPQSQRSQSPGAPPQATSPQETYCQPDVPAALPFDLANAAQPLSLTLLSGAFSTPSTYTSSSASVPIPSIPLTTNNYYYAPTTTTTTTTTTTLGSPIPTTTITTTTAESESESESFADSYYLPVPPLTLLRALVRIATRLNAMPSALSLSAASPFTTGRGAPDPSQLPPAWRPTPTQLAVPHHPVLDLLPWPAVRDRMIGYLSLGLEENISNSSSSGNSGGNGNGSGSVTGSLLLDFIYDMEDGAEGIRVWGADPYDEANWEVGQAVFERWWFVFDKRVVEVSNRWRRRRGAEPLRIAGA
ncbi:uncharacterized protein B0T15DRAFT_417003 [Chaetomium strumarium]|uniref:BZIP domain-containing protein n=1 Tax=Chaetomium strumarium TaxID=1170767 RepID=A0AAJ0GTS1_9PEZI|nr:hypothetical protein B0T15DRAFT_417003 [Chaetomium strumarium]